jgi:glycosyltransferase involved in cell wall biosynthesis
MKVALVHYWLVAMRGGEKVLEALCELYPEADIFTHVYDEKAISPAIKKHKITTTFIQKLPRASKYYKKYLPFMPYALESLDLREYDLIISSEAGPAKGVITRPDALHICYCHSPMRYLWDQYHVYRKNAGWLTRMFMSVFFPYLRLWDAVSANRVDSFVANSRFIAKRIRKFYRRDATVIHPPVSVRDFTVENTQGDYYLCLGMLVPYKRFDIAITAFSLCGKKLIVAGTGDETERLKSLAGPNIQFVGWQSDEQIRGLLAHCKALIFPTEEDFGIVPIEAMACGRPVIAYKAGGVLETVVHGKTGILFDHQTPESLQQAVADFETRPGDFSPQAIRDHAMTFEREIFKTRFREHVEAELANFNKV